MLSILIPVYNFRIIDLVEDLLQQARRLEVKFEIRCYDDHSNIERLKIENRSLQQYPEVVYKELSKNLGRSKIRNLLAKEAAFEFLLFMDCDSKVVSKGYIQTYLDEINPQTLLYGGRIYSLNPPEDKNLFLHWYFGSEREVIQPSVRAEHPYQSFMTNNFLIPKSIFQEIQFDESLTQYGHEDTLFGMHLQEKGITIQHLNNPLEHIGLERTGIFLQKTRKAIANLWLLHQSGYYLDSKLLKTYLFLEKYGLKSTANITLNLIQPIIKFNLHSNKPKLIVLDLFKLTELLRMAKLN